MNKLGQKIDMTVDAESKVEAREVASSDHEEYLNLCQEFQGEKLHKLNRRVDWHVIPQLMLVYMLSYIDRGNVGNARLFGAEADLHLGPQDWNTGLTVFFATYALSGPPANLLVKRFGPKKLLPAMLMCVSFVLIGAGCAHNRAQWFALRLLLGVFEAGMYPACAFVLTTWYPPALLHGRTTIFYVAGSAAGAFGGLFAYALAQADGTWGFRGWWRWIYVIEGLLSFVVSAAAFFWIQETPANQGRWLAPEESRFLVLQNKFAYGNDSSGQYDSFNWRDVKAAAKSWHVWVLSWVLFSICIAVYGVSFTLPTIMSNLGFSTKDSQLLSAPPYVFAGLCTVLSGWCSDKYRKRTMAVVIPSVVAWIGLLICVTTVKHKSLVPLTYIGTCLAIGGLYCLSPGTSVWLSLNIAGQTKRAAGIAIEIVFAQFGGLVGSNIFLTKEKPGYPTGFGVSLGIMGLGGIVTPLLYMVALKRVNAKREAMSEEEIREKYTSDELEKMGDLSPYYRYEY